MSKKPGRKGPKGKSSSPAKRTAPDMEKLRDYVRNEGAKFLDDPNITSIGVGYKHTGGKATGKLAIQFTVAKKRPQLELEGIGTALIPKTVEVDGVAVPTDVVERKFHPAYRLVELENKELRKQRLQTLVPGISVSHPKGTAGTLGAIVYDAASGQPCMLSNWHVLQTPDGTLGDTIVQPGPYDDNRTAANSAGVLVRSHLGVAGDCAIARIEGRGFDPRVMDLGVAVRRIGRVELGDKVVKSGRTTGVTFGVVSRVDVTSKLDYGGQVGVQRIGGFEIAPIEDRKGEGHEVSQGGDSGSVWLIADARGKATDVMVGLHFAGEGPDNPDDYALACYAHAVFKKLEITVDPPAGAVEVGEAYKPNGYDPEFLTVKVETPVLTGSRARDYVRFSGGRLIPYTHFSVCLSKSHRLPHFVVWNIDGQQIKTYSRKGLDFKLDPRIDEDYQIGDELYSSNKLDRGHIARRADLVWGGAKEAKQANKDSFYFTNICPQHQAFNQSQRHGLWGMLENAIFDEVDVEDLRITLIGGPIFSSGDPEYRHVRIPRSFWKVIAYVDEADHQLKVKAYVLTQKDLLADIEAFALEPFRLYEVTLARLKKDTKLDFGRLSSAEAPATEAVGRPTDVREIRSAAELFR